MPLPSGPWLRIVNFYRLPDAAWENVFWWKPTSTLPGSFNIQTAAQEWNTAWGAVNDDLRNPDAVFLGCKAYVRSGSATVSAQAALGSNGGGSGQALPSEIAVVVRQNTAAGGPSGRGRHYLGGIDNTMVFESRLSPGGVTQMNTIKTFLQTSLTLNGTSFDPCIYSKKLGTITAVSFASYDVVCGHRTHRRPVF